MLPNENRHILSIQAWGFTQFLTPPPTCILHNVLWSHMHRCLSVTTKKPKKLHPEKYTLSQHTICWRWEWLTAFKCPNYHCRTKHEALLNICIATQCIYGHPVLYWWRWKINKFISIDKNLKDRRLFHHVHIFISWTNLNSWPLGSISKSGKVFSILYWYLLTIIFFSTTGSFPHPFNW